MIRLGMRGLIGRPKVPPPVFTASPVITGSDIVGETLTATTGTATGTGVSYSGQWRRGGVNISGQTASTYVLVSGDIGANIDYLSTASNPGGAVTSDSNDIGPIYSAANVWNPADKGAGVTLSQGNRRAVMAFDSVRAVTSRGGIIGDQGNRYFEITINVVTTTTEISCIGISRSDLSRVNRFYDSANSIIVNPLDGNVFRGGSNVGNIGACVAGDVIGCELRTGASGFYINRNGGTQLALSTGGYDFKPSASGGNALNVNLNTGQSAFAYQPGGTVAWN